MSAKANVRSRLEDLVITGKDATRDAILERFLAWVLGGEGEPVGRLQQTLAATDRFTHLVFYREPPFVFGLLAYFDGSHKLEARHVSSGALLEPQFPLPDNGQRLVVRVGTGFEAAEAQAFLRPLEGDV